MKRIFIASLSFAVLLTALAGCTKNSPKAAAETFLNGLYHYDFDAARSVSTEETKKMIDLMAQFSAMMPDSMKQEAKKVKVTIKDVKEDGDKATATFTLSDNPAEKKIGLVKVYDSLDKDRKNGKWLVQYSKMDENLEDNNNNSEPAEEPVSDSAAMPPADGTLVDTTQHP